MPTMSNLKGYEMVDKAARARLDILEAGGVPGGGGSVPGDITEQLTDIEARLTALENIDIAEGGAY